jgi:hypothetical protein
VTPTCPTCGTVTWSAAQTLREIERLIETGDQLAYQLDLVAKWEDDHVLRDDIDEWREAVDRAKKPIQGDQEPA